MSAAAIFDNTVTFRLADATIDLPPIDMGYSGDVYFEFRTTKEAGTFFHVQGDGGDFLKVSMKRTYRSRRKCRLGIHFELC